MYEPVKHEKFYHFQRSILAGLLGTFVTGILYIILEDSNLLNRSPFHIAGGFYSFIKIFFPAVLGAYFCSRTMHIGKRDYDGKLTDYYSIWPSIIIGTLVSYFLYFILTTIMSFFDFIYLELYLVGIVNWLNPYYFHVWTLVPAFIGAWLNHLLDI